MNHNIEKLIEDKEYCIDICEQIENENKDIINNFNKILQDQDLITLLKKSRKNENISRFLSDILNFINSTAITDAVFKKILNYRGKYKKSFLISLSHAPLAHYQLQKLSILHIDSEAFCQLAIMYSENECFSPYDLEYLITQNKDYLEDLKYLAENFIKISTLNEYKQKIIKRWTENL